LRRLIQIHRDFIILKFPVQCMRRKCFKLEHNSNTKYCIPSGMPNPYVSLCLCAQGHVRICPRRPFTNDATKENKIFKICHIVVIFLQRFSTLTVHPNFPLDCSHICASFSSPKPGKPGSNNAQTHMQNIF